MPWVSIKTGIVAQDGQEAVLREYHCDWPGCAHLAEHLVGVVRDMTLMRSMCPEHIAMMQARQSTSRSD